MKVNQIRKIQFWGLRNSVSCSGGVCFDNDEKVTWLCRVVRVADGLKWQIIKNKQQWDSYLIEYDQESLNEASINDVEIINDPMIKYSWSAQRGAKYHKSHSFLPF